MFFFYVRIISWYCFIMTAASSSAFALSAFSSNSPVSIISLLIMESINCFLIFFLLSLLVFFVVLEPFCCYKQKSNHYNTNLKHPLQTKNAMCSLILRWILILKRVLLCMIKVCKNTPSPPFLKNSFSDQPYQ